MAFSTNNKVNRFRETGKTCGVGLTVVVGGRDFHNICATIEEKYEGSIHQSEMTLARIGRNIHEVETSKATDDTLDFTGRQASDLRCTS